MSFHLRNTRSISLAAATLSGCALLTGCGAGFQPSTLVQTTTVPASKPRFTVSGNVHGGVYPIQGATIRLMLTQSNGYAGAALQLDQTTSDVNGYFSFPNADTCPTTPVNQANQFAYITVSSGHTSTNAANNNVVLVGVIGSCATDLAPSEIQNVEVFVSELSTVAAAYALGNFISIDSTTDGTGQQLVNISAPPANNSALPSCTGLGTGTGGMACTAAGLAHGFANAYNLVDSVRYDGSFPRGAARTTLPGNSSATVPQALINTLGNILQSCVDSPGGATTESTNSNGVAVYTSDGSHCGDLFSDGAPPNGFPAAGAVASGSTPTNNVAPTNTLQVALNMSKYPTNNVDALFRLQPRAVFFQPDLSSDTLSNNPSTLMAYTISIFYLGTGIAGDPGMPYPVDVALDAQDNAYVVYSDAKNGTYAGLDEIGANGAGIFAGGHQVAVPNPNALALDAKGEAWVTNDNSTGNVVGFSTPSTGGINGTIANTINIPNGYAGGLAIDSSNNLFVSRDVADNNQSVFVYQAANGYAAATFAQCTATVFFGQCVQLTPLPPYVKVVPLTPTPPKIPYPSKRAVIDSLQNFWGVTSNAGKADVFTLAYGSNGTQANLYSSVLDTTGGLGIAVDGNDHAFFPLAGTLDTESATTAGAFTAGAAGTYTGTSTTGSAFNAPVGAALDGADSVFWSDFEASGQVFMLTPHNGSATGGTLISFFPCYPLNGQCYSAASSYLRSMAIDSSGAMWYVADSTTGAVVQTLGLAAPTWPLLSYTHAGQRVDAVQ